MNEAWDFLSRGGPVMIPIGLCSVIAMTIFLERVWALQRNRIVPLRFSSLLKEAMRAKRWERARSLCESSETSLARLGRAALRYVGYQRMVVVDSLVDAGRREAAYLERFVGVLGVVATVAPLLGLLGTVTGMIDVFSRLAAEFDKGGEVNPGLLASGLWEALITTAAGLSVAIPSFLLYRILLARIDRFVVELEQEGAQMAELIAPPPLAEQADASAEPQSAAQESGE